MNGIATISIRLRNRLIKQKSPDERRGGRTERQNPVVISFEIEGIAPGFFSGYPEVDQFVMVWCLRFNVPFAAAALA